MKAQHKRLVEYSAKHSTNDSHCDFCSCLFDTSSSVRGLILPRLRYVVLIITKADMAASQRYVVENRIKASRALFANSGYSSNILHRNFISEEELNLAFAT